MRQYHLTSRVDIGDNTPYNDMKRQATNDFFAINSVFSLDEATEALSPPGGKSGTVERLKYHLQIGRLKLVAREIYAVVPPGVAFERFRPDPFLVAAAIRPTGVFAYHSAMELLGAAHAFWNIYTLYVEKPRKSLALNGITVKFLNHPKENCCGAQVRSGHWWKGFDGRICPAVWKSWWFRLAASQSLILSCSRTSFTPTMSVISGRQ